MFKKFTALVALMYATLGWKEVPVEEGKVKMSEDEKAQMQEKLGDTPIEEVLRMMNKEVAAYQAKESDQEALLKKAQAELRSMLDETSLSEKEKEKLLNPAPGGEMSLTEQLAAVKTEMANQFKNLKEDIKKLGDTAEGDSPADLIDSAKAGAKIKHSSTHLFGSDKAYDAFEGRPWNKAAAGIDVGATDFSDKVVVDKLSGDLELYYRENPDKIKDLNRDNFGLPSFWPKRLKVDDRVSDGFIATAEITQARKLNWAPKNKQKIEAEEGKIFPVQIDAEFIGFNLQKMEASWLNAWNKEGSQAYKLSFVAFLVNKLDTQARVEDRKSTIGAIYVATPEDATTAGRTMSRQDGLLYQIWRAINVTKKLKPFSVGAPTTANIVDYVDDMLKKLPDEIRETANLKFYLSREWIRAYKRRYEQVYGTYSDYKGYPEHPKDFENVDFVPLYDLSGTDVMFITFPDNIEILENVPAEKGKYHFEMLKRIMYVFADYKLGVRLIHIGTTTGDGDPDEFKVQTIWSNNVPLFKSSFYIPVYDDATGKINAKYNHLEVDAGWSTAVTEFTGTYEGQVIRLRGNTGLSGTVNVTDGAKINLAGDASFDLSSGGTLTLIANGDGTVTEVKRTTSPETAPAGTIDFGGTTFDATAGSSFAYTGGAATLASITGGVEGQLITILGGAGGDLTINDVATIEVASEAVVSDGDSIEFVLVDGVWTEKSRTIA